MIPIIVFLDVMFFAISFYYLRKDRQAKKKEGLIREMSRKGASNETGEGLFKREKTKSRLEKALDGKVDLSTLESLLISADMPLSLERFIFFSLGTGLLFLVPVMILFRNILLMFVLLAAGLLLPFAYLVFRKKKREEALVQQLPDTLEMIVRALKVGQSVDGALKEVGHGFPPPIGTEIRTIYDEMAMGLPFETALRNFEGRFPNIPDVKMLCTAFIIQRETGGNLTQILDNLSGIIRERFQMKRQLKALTAEGRISALILGILPLAFIGITWIFNPGYISILFTHPFGKKLLLLAFLFVATGFVMMRFMSRIDV